LIETPHSPIPLTVSSPTVMAARDYVLNLYNTRAIGKKLVFHNLKSTIQLVNYTNEIGHGELLKEDLDATILAAWFCFTGYVKSYSDPLKESLNFLNDFCTNHKCDDKTVKDSTALISIYYDKSSSSGKAAAVFKDAAKALHYGPDFKVAQNLLQYEIELNGGEEIDRLTLQNNLLDGLLSAQLATPYAIEQYGKIIGQNIISTRKQVKKLDPSKGLDAQEMERFDQIEEGIPHRGIHSYFRSIYRVHINLSAIADNKANIMISVNAILISVLISLLSYKNISETNPAIMVPVLVFIVAGLASLIFAVLSARPKINYPNKGITDRNLLKRNAVFFGSFVTLKLDEYEDIMDEIFKDGKLIYGNMIRDMYFLGKVLDKKYQFLIISYNIFMIGFAITVLSFLIILFVL